MMLLLVFLTGATIESQAVFHDKSMQIFKGPSSLSEGSLFGYSISYESKYQSLIVSAPKANDVGRIFTININNSVVKEVHIPLIRLTPNLIKHDFWLGATVKANSDYFVICTPRYSEIKSDRSVKKPATVGICFIKHQNGKVTPLKPMTNGDRIINADNMKFKKMMDSFGWSMELTSQNELLVGAPAMNKGRVLIYPSDLGSATPKLIYKISYGNPVLYNFGYSIASGKFFSKQITYAVSTTFGELGFGKVYFFNSKYENIGAINDDNLGTMFGAALCSANFGVDALLVGAPAFADNDYTYDIGAVYIFMAQSGSSSNEMTLKRKLVGKTSGGHFGHAIVSIGDMDGDSKDEIAIAAPYDDDGRGAVYIYTGEGILQGKLSQKIQPEGFYNLGISLAVVKDYDGNGCNELAISSPKNTSVVLLRSMTVVTVNLHTKFPNFQNYKNKTHFEFDSCLDVLPPKNLKVFKVDLIVNILTTDRNSKLIGASENKSLTYEVSLNENNQSFCRSIGVQSILTPVKEYNLVIAYKISVTLKDDPLTRDDFDISRAILSEHSVLDLNDKQWISDCGGKLCIPNLKHSLNSSIPIPYVLGSSNMEKFTLSVRNIGQTAYDACAIVTVLEARVLRPPPGCTLLKDSTQFICKPNQPLRNGEIWNIHPIEVETTLLTSGNDELTIQSDLYNNCNNKTDRNTFEDKFILRSDIDNISLKGQTNPDQTVNMTRNDVYDLGKSMEHVYTISNNGKTNWIGIKSEIILDNVPYINYSGAPITISKDKSSGMECSTTNSSRTESQIIVLCDIGDLKRNQKVNVIIAIAIPPNTLDFKEENENVTITTTFNLLLNDESISLSLNTVLRFITVPVALWIIIISSFVGLLILAIISFALYECGFLQRKNKDKLKKLKKEVHRQSVRRSMMRESMRAAASRRSTEDNHLLKPELD
ncbi:integrin alpha-V-like isoform X2 [Nymphalis io]|uniref:integrin alpha-V-like isoform X2 n=1 Tax=Inachis io TaxID=171585 RepID=UPI002167A901|nr:integrin alpha-V-like isoform X2 [Nymphalis io]